MNVLTIRNLEKNYGSLKAVDDLSLTIDRGQVYGILGPNGSGKTTTLGICAGILHPTAGNFTWFNGKYGNQYRRRMGILLETPNFYTYLSALENLKIVQMQKESYEDNLDEILDIVGLLHRKTSKFKHFSLGMKQRLALGAALVGAPEVLILDEPTNGLDPSGIAEIRELIRSIASHDKTIIMASHILDEVEKVCTHVGILKTGRLIAEGKVGSILGDDNLIEIASDNQDHLETALQSYDFIKNIEEKENHLLLTVDDQINATQLNKLLVEKGIYVSTLKKVSRRLEDEFLTLTNNA